MRQAKTQISLRIRPVWLESSLSAWRSTEPLAYHWAHRKGSDQTGRMPRLIWVFLNNLLKKKYSNCVNIGFWTIVSSKIGVCESIITYEQKASIPLIAMMYILHRLLNGKFLPLADFWCEPRHSQVKIEGRETHFSVRKWFTRLTSLVYQGVSTMTCFHIIWIGRHG